MNKVNKQLLKQLPTEVFYLLTADKALDLTTRLIERYDFNGIQAAALVELIESVYLKQLRLAELYNQVKSLFNFDETRLRSFVCDLAGYKFLAVSDWLGEDVANYIRSLGGNASDYITEAEELKKAAAMELATDRLIWQDEPSLPNDPDDGKAFNPYPNDPEYDAIVNSTSSIGDEDYEDEDSDDNQSLSPELLMEQFQDLLVNDLPDLLEVDDNFFIAQFNYQLINLLVDYPDFKDRLIGVLLNHSLQLGTDNLMIDGRQLAPTVGAWINYFINQKGSIMFDAITLSDFLITAASAKLLSPLDKDHLSRLLWLYRNLKFFPDSLVGDDPANWELLTYVSEEANLTSPAPTSSPSTNPASPITANPLADKIKALEQLAAQYPAGGLERLAIEEEIKRLQAS